MAGTAVEVRFERPVLDFGGSLDPGAREIKVIEHPRMEPGADWIPYPEAETWQRMTDRVAQCMDRLAIESMPTAIIVTHECIASAIVKWRLRLLELIRYGIEFKFRPCSVAELAENESSERIIVRLNDTAHLKGDSGGTP